MSKNLDSITHTDSEDFKQYTIDTRCFSFEVDQQTVGKKVMEVCFCTW